MVSRYGMSCSYIEDFKSSSVSALISWGGSELNSSVWALRATVSHGNDINPPLVGLQ